MSVPFGLTVPARDSDVADKAVAAPVVVTGEAFVVNVVSCP